MDKSKRIDFIDQLKGFAIILIAWGHVISAETPFKIWIYSFHVPLFFMVTGFLISKKNNFDIKKQLYRILYPYFMFSAMVVLLNFLLIIFFQSSNYKILISIVLNTITLEGFRSLWFLPALLIAQTIFYITKNRNYLRVFIVIFTIFLTTLLQNHDSNNDIDLMLIKIGNLLNRAFIGYIFILVGCKFNSIYMAFNNYITSNKYAQKIISITILIVMFFISQINGYVDLHYSVVNNQLLYYINAIINSFFVFLLFSTLKIENSTLSYFGKYSLIIMATHIPLDIISFVDDFLNSTKGSISVILYDLLVLIIVLTIEFLIIKMIMKYLPFLVSGRTKKNRR